MSVTQDAIDRAGEAGNIRFHPSGIAAVEGPFPDSVGDRSGTSVKIVQVA
jgi:hypothetical protein